MAAEDIRGTERLDSARALSLAVLKQDKHGFRLGLIGAVVSHALLIALFVGASQQSLRRMGETSGSLDGISVVLVDEADFKSRNTVPLEGTMPPGDASTATPAREAAKPAPQPAERTTEQQKQLATSLAKETPDLLAVPDLTGRPPERPAERRDARPQQQPQQRPEPSPKQSKPESPTIPGEKYASFARPAGITRSGENDDFGRGVIRALRQTMPQLRSSRGRVTIRFLLSETGNLVEVRVVASTGDAALTQSVVFASKQSSFPIPPRGSTVIDRTFLVTYIYD